MGGQILNREDLSYRSCRPAKLDKLAEVGQGDRKGGDGGGMRGGPSEEKDRN